MQERQKALEEMGISIHKAGVAIDRNRFYLVNLNEDPAMSEMLVYYLKEPLTRVGRGGDGVPQQDVVLSGLAIKPEHALLHIEEALVYVEAMGDARVIVNGTPLAQRLRLRHGDRVLFGSKHLFRVVCPRAEGDPELAPDWAFAQQELATGEKSLAEMEREKEQALEEQRLYFEGRLASLSQDDSGGTAPKEELTPADRRRLYDELVSAASVTREANDLAKELCYPVSFELALRLSQAALKEPSLRGLEAREIAVAIHHTDSKLPRYRQIDSFERYLERLQELYQRSLEMEPEEPLEVSGGTQLIGVANLYLTGLQHGMACHTSARVLTQDGRECGTLLIHFMTEARLEDQINANGGLQTDAITGAGQTSPLAVRRSTSNVSREPVSAF